MYTHILNVPECVVVVVFGDGILRGHHLYMCKHRNIYICMYIYIYIERERLLKVCAT